MKAIPLFLLFATPLFAQTLRLKEFDYPVPDIASQGFKKEELYKSMNHSFMRMKDSICSNRAHMWVYDFKKKLHVEPAKVFLFYTAKTGFNGRITWWYHVAPILNENGKFWVMDAGYPDRVKGPLLVKDWLKEFNGETSVCKEIKEGDDDLVELMFSEKSFPEVTRHGKYNCYYKLAPPGYWTPEGLAKHILGRDASGAPVRYVRNDISKKEVYSACLEVATSPYGYALGRGKAICSNYIRTGFLKF